ncbi:leukocyte receptor cluster member 8 homolog isoform X7 [Dermacentor silvarum]|uniref:leukocyte receptor cluster member 8 homolog isoform X7 n=1 Tax=Dermacentor silvarum TaxID=543639 RepID=UPI00189BAC03|nr:leukocyte receptor cluster member 8 homolog isoform X7 [Dermacentor silvarum]
MAAVQAFEQAPTVIPWDKPEGGKEMEASVPVDPSQAWENARKALEKVQTTNGKTTPGTEQPPAPGYGAGFGYPFWPGQQQPPQQGCMYPGYMGYNGYPPQGPGGAGYGFYPNYNMYGGGYFPASPPVQYPQPGGGGAAGNSGSPTSGPSVASGAPPPPPGEQAPSEKEGAASEAPASGTPPQAQQQQQPQPPMGFGQPGPAPGFGPGFGAGYCPPGPGYGFYYGYNGMVPNGEMGPRGPAQFGAGMQGKQAPGAGGVRFNLPKRGKFGGRGGSRANAFQQQRMAQGGGQRSAADATQRLEDCMANLTPHGGDWPESLKRYAMRAFGKCKSELDRDQVEIVLKGKLTKMYRDGAMWSIDWDKEPLPSIHSERLQQEQQKTGPGTAIGASGPEGANKGGSGALGLGLPLQPPLGSTASSKLPSPSKPGVGLGRRLGGLMAGRLGPQTTPAGAAGGRPSSSASGGDSPPGFIPLKSGGGRRGDWGRGSSSSRRSPRSRSRSRSRSWSPRSRSPAPTHTPARDRRKKRRSSSIESSPSPEVTRSSKKVLNSSVSSYSHGGNNNGGKNKKSGQGGRKANKKQKKQQQQQQQQMIQFQVEEDMATTEKLQKRAARFQSAISAGKKKRPFSLVLSINAGPNLGPSSGDGDTELDWESFPIVGTCQDLEKQYLRLTSAPDPSTIRPVEVLRESLDMVKEQWLQKQDYHYACDQLKSIRQDLTVQCVRDPFTVQVYETHARIALEKGDHEEFNQCQTQLKTLYQELHSGNALEFLGYRILYNVFARNTLELKTILAHLSSSEKTDEVVKHALEVCHAWSLGNYARFFKLYERPPKMSGYLMDWFALRERRNALKAMVKAYRPVLPVEYVERTLGFADRDDVLAFLAELNVTLAEDGASVDCKESLAAVLAA